MGLADQDGGGSWLGARRLFGMFGALHFSCRPVVRAMRSCPQVRVRVRVRAGRDSMCHSVLEHLCLMRASLVSLVSLSGDYASDSTEETLAHGCVNGWFL